MTEPFYAPHQLAELQEGYYAVNRTYEQLLGEYLSLRLTSECSTWFRSQTRHAEAQHRHQHRAADDRRAGGLADVERELIRIRTGERRTTRRNGKILAEKPKLTPWGASARRSSPATRAEFIRAVARTYEVDQSTISGLTA
jgi:hypothetical protein